MPDIKIEAADVARLTRTEALINHSNERVYGQPDAYKDKAFTTMTPTLQGRTLFLDIDGNTPAATLNNDLADAIKMRHGVEALSVPRIRSGQVQIPQWLISVGTLMSNPQGELLTFKRTVTGPNGMIIAWPAAMNNPMGRCEGFPSYESLKEGAQELAILEVVPPTTGFNRQAALRPQQFTYGTLRGISVSEEEDLIRGLEKHLQQAGKSLPHPMTTPGMGIKAVADDRYADKLKQVVTRVNGRVVDEFEAVAVFSPAERTIEMAIPLRLAPNKPTEIIYYAREPFGREMHMMNPEQLEAAHYAWAMGISGTRDDPEQKRTIHLGGILPILQGAVLGLEQGVSRPDEVVVPKAWPETRIRSVLGL